MSKARSVKTLFHWGRDFLKRVELLTQEEDLAKKPEIPQATGLRKRLIDATNRANEKRKNLIDKLKGNNVR